MLTKPGAVQNPLPQRHISSRAPSCQRGNMPRRNEGSLRICPVDKGTSVHVWLSWGVEISAGANFSLFGSDPLRKHPLVSQTWVALVVVTSFVHSAEKIPWVGREFKPTRLPHPGPTKSLPSNPFTSQ